MKKCKCLVSTIVFLFFFAGCALNGEINDTGKEIATEANMTIGKVEDDVFEIKTDYCTLKYPNEWKDVVDVDVTNNKVTFIHKESGTVVFDIVFGEGEGYLLGSIKDEKLSFDVKIYSHEVDENSEYYPVFCAIEGDVNVIINHLSNDYNFETGA